MAFDIGRSYPDLIKESRRDSEEQHVTKYDRWIQWKAWRAIPHDTVDVAPSTLALPWTGYPMITDIRGCQGLIVSVSTPILTIGELTDVTDWAGRLWVCAGPPATAQWAMFADSDTGAMGTATYSKIFEIPGFWYAAYQIYALTATVGEFLYVSVRPI